MGNSNHIKDFNSLKHYSFGRVCLFFLISNLGLGGLVFVKYCMTKPKLSEVNFELQISRAISTFELHTNYGMTDLRLVKLKREFDAEVKEKYVPMRVSNIDDAPASIKKDLKKLDKSLLKGEVSLYHTNNELKYIKVENSKTTKHIIKYEQGLYDVNGVRLDKVDIMLKPLQLVTPVGGKKPRISSAYGMRIHPVLGTRSFHAGIDIASPKNSSIHSALDGVVKLTAYNRVYGTYIIIKHRNNLETLYAHLDSINPKISIGKKVKQGEIIGKVGRTGRATGCHVHFETRINGKHTNPNGVKPMKYKLQGQDLKKFMAVKNLFFS